MDTYSYVYPHSFNAGSRSQTAVTVALILIPQSMAYAQLAGMPAYYGLYASLMPTMIAAFFGSSRQLATGPVALVSLMTAAALLNNTLPSNRTRSPVRR